MLPAGIIATSQNPSAKLSPTNDENPKIPNEKTLDFKVDAVAHHSFASLPDELKMHVFQLLPNSNLDPAKRVCRDWQRLIKDPKFVMNRKIQTALSNSKGVEALALQIAQLWDKNRPAAEILLKATINVLANNPIAKQLDVIDQMTKLWSQKFRGNVSSCHPKVKELVLFIKNQTKSTKPILLRMVRSANTYNHLNGTYGELSNGKPLPKDLQLPGKCQFPAMKVDQFMSERLSISSKNTFKNDELVATIFEPEGQPSNLFYGVIRDTKTDSEGTWYSVGTHYSANKNAWTESVWRLSGAIGKIPFEPACVKLLR